MVDGVDTNRGTVVGGGRGYYLKVRTRNFTICILHQIKLVMYDLLVIIGKVGIFGVGSQATCFKNLSS